MGSITSSLTSLACKQTASRHPLFPRQLTLHSTPSLAILGEASVLANAQVSALSWFFLLPRLVPAPQALIRTTRPERLDTAKGKVFGVESGSVRDYILYVAHTLHNGSSLPDYTVRCEEITEKSDQDVQARTWGPLTLLSILGCAMSIALVVTSIVKQDGMALVATLLLSCLSSLVGIGSRWKIKFRPRESDRDVPRSDVVIVYPQGSFLIVKCEEAVARQLYWHPPECQYVVGTTSYRVISLVGTLMLMFGVICLGNATLLLQILYAGAYLILNAAYWTVAALPPTWNWDLGHFEVKRIYYEKDEQCKTFTKALWRAIAISRSTKWVHDGKVAPLNKGWKDWLQEAEQAVLDFKEEQDSGKDGSGENPRPLPDWEPEKALTDALARQMQESALRSV